MDPRKLSRSEIIKLKDIIDSHDFNLNGRLIIYDGVSKSLGSLNNGFLVLRHASRHHNNAGLRLAYDVLRHELAKEKLPFYECYA